MLGYREVRCRLPVTQPTAQPMCDIRLLLRSTTCVISVTRLWFFLKNLRHMSQPLLAMKCNLSKIEGSSRE